MFIKDRPVSSLVVFVFEFLGASFSRFGCFVFDRCFVFEFRVLRFRDLGASCFGLRFRVPRFRNYLGFFGNNLRPGVLPHLLLTL